MAVFLTGFTTFPSSPQVISAHKPAPLCKTKNLKKSEKTICRITQYTVWALGVFGWVCLFFFPVRYVLPGGIQLVAPGSLAVLGAQYGARPGPACGRALRRCGGCWSAVPVRRRCGGGRRAVLRRGRRGGGRSCPCKMAAAGLWPARALLGRPGGALRALCGSVRGLAAGPEMHFGFQTVTEAERREKSESSGGAGRAGPAWNLTGLLVPLGAGDGFWAGPLV